MSIDEPRQPGSEPNRLTPAQIERQDFSRARKGLDEKEVRALLRRVADEIDAANRRIADLEAEVRHPPLPSRDQLVEQVGHEVARTLRSAEDSAEKVAQRARKSATEVERAAREESARIRTEQLEQATKDARAIVEAARERGREMVAEARALRERVLTDLNRRRDTLRAYIDQLRTDRDRFAEAYRVVRDTVSDANEMLTHFGAGRPFPPVDADAGPPIKFPAEAKAADEEPAAPVFAPEQRPRIRPPRAARPARPARAERDAPSRPRAAPATGIGLGELPGRAGPAPPVRHTEPEPAPEPESEPDVWPEVGPEADDEPVPAAEAEPAAPAPEPEPASDAAPAPEPEPEPASDAGTSVDALFERIRATRGDVVEEPRIDFGGGSDDAGAGEQAPNGAQGQVLVETVPEPRPSTEGDPELLARRDELLTPIAQELVRQSKRVLQNEQNEILDALRRERGRLTAEKLLPPLASQVEAWSEVLAPAITEAYVAARTAAASTGEPVNGASPRMVSDMVEVLVTPLRDRLLTVVEETLGDDANPDVIAHRIGARYREWKGEELDSRIRDLLAAVYARGVYDAAPEGSRLRWVPAEQGQCPDADDNALEPTRRGERFPTGQQFPPAHPGCRCLLAVVHEMHGQHGDE
ncbi:MAG TPA: DivIVA domain-containing protein [Acidimicrobiia bacterium]|nr:DivIVA domain-containing protein [Acidimicrobiia bacterium]